MDDDRLPLTHIRFVDLLDEAKNRYRDQVLRYEALVLERNRLRKVVEGLLGVLGKYVDADEIARWRAMMIAGTVPLAGDGPYR